MSILINGIEMPTEYGRCMVIFPDGRVTTEFGSQVIANAFPVPEHGRLVVLDRETALAIAAGSRAIQTTKRFNDASYVYDPLGKNGGPYEIPYVKAGYILRNIWDEYPLDGEKAEEGMK